MKRILVIRLFTLELAPMVGSLALSAYSQRLMPLAFAVAAVTIFTFAALALREGVVLGKGVQCICERNRDKFGYWFYIAVHFSFGAFFLAGAAIMFFDHEN
ncbi:MAG: hypothetical protein HZA31_06545 [Opitutae bacterium]|nr:hypothetical protein [Opitutae bacterium]